MRSFRIWIMKTLRPILYKAYKAAFDKELDIIMNSQKKAIATGIEAAHKLDVPVILMMNEDMIDGVAKVIVSDQLKEEKKPTLTLVKDEEQE